MEKPLTTIEKWFVALGLVFMVGGGYMVFHPAEGVVLDPGTRLKTKMRPPAPVERVSKSESRVYGGAAVAMGAGILWLALSFRQR